MMDRPALLVKVKTSDGAIIKVPVYPTGKQACLDQIYETADGRTIAIGKDDDGRFGWDEPAWEGLTVVGVRHAQARDVRPEPDAPRH